MRIAVLRHVLGRGVTSASDAVYSFIADDLAVSLPPMARQVSDDFRDSCCYTPETDAALRRHEGWLRALFRSYALGDGALGQVTATRPPPVTR